MQLYESSISLFKPKEFYDKNLQLKKCLFHEVFNVVCQILTI